MAGKIQISDTEQSRTVKTALALYMLLEENSSRRPCVLPDMDSQKKQEDMRVLRDFVSSMSFMLNEKVEELDNDRTNAIGMARAVRGTGKLDFEEEDEDEDRDTEFEDEEENRMSNISSLASGKPIVTNQARLLAETASRCESILNGDFMSVKDADFLVRGVTELLGTPVYEAWSGEDEDKEKKKSGPAIRRILGDMKNVLGNDPYSRLRGIVSEIFGSGAVKELEGLKSPGLKRTRVADQDLSSVSGIKKALMTIGGIPVQGSSANWDASFPTEINEIISSMVDGKGKLKPEFRSKDNLEKEDGRILRLYAGVSEKEAPTPKDCLKAVAKKDREKISAVKYWVGRNMVELPLEGLGHVLNPATYANADDPDSPMALISNMFRDVKVLYAGRQTAIQNKLLTAARVLCGINERGSLNKLKGETWFPDALADSPVNNAVPFELQEVAGKNLSDFVSTFFSIDSEYSKLEAIPLALLDENSPVVAAIDNEKKNCRKVLERMKKAIDEVVRSEDMKMQMARLEDASVDVRRFHLLDSPADERSSEPPYIIAAQVARDMFSGLCSAISNGKLSSRQVKELSDHLKERIDSSESGEQKEFAIRMAEAMSMKISPCPPGWQTKSPDEAYSEIQKEIETIGNPTSHVLDNLLFVLTGYGPWDKGYGEIVENQVERRKQFEIGRMAQWNEVFREAFKALTEPKDLGNGISMTYTDAVTYASKSVNTMIAAVLCDCVMKKGGMKAGKVLDNDGFSILVGKYARRSEGEKIDFDPLEEKICSMFMEPFADHAYKAAVKRRNRNFIKTGGMVSEQESADLLGRGLEPIDSGSVMNFSSSIIASDPVFGALLDLNALMEGARVLPEGENRNTIYEYAKEAEMNLLGKFMGRKCTQAEFDVADGKSGMSAEEQYSLVGFALDEWRLSAELKASGKDAEAEESMKKALGYIDDAKENNPVLCLWGYSNDLAFQNGMSAEEIKSAMESYDQNTEIYLKSLRYADMVAQFNERIGNGNTRMLLDLSEKYLQKTKNDAVLAVKEYDNSLKADEAPIMRIGYGISRVFSPKLNVILHEGLRSGTEAEKWVAQISMAEARTARRVACETAESAIEAICRNFRDKAGSVKERYAGIKARWEDTSDGSFGFGIMNGGYVLSHETDKPRNTDTNRFGEMKTSNWTPSSEWAAVVDILFTKEDDQFKFGYGFEKLKDIWKPEKRYPSEVREQTGDPGQEDLGKWNEMQDRGTREALVNIVSAMDEIKRTMDSVGGR